MATVFARGSRAVVARNTADDTPSDTAFDQRDGWRTRAPLGLLSPLPAVRCRQAGLIEMKRAAVRAVISSAMMALTVTTAAEPHVLSANHPRGCRELVARANASAPDAHINDHLAAYWPGCHRRRQRIVVPQVEARPQRMRELFVQTVGEAPFDATPPAGSFAPAAARKSAGYKADPFSAVEAAPALILPPAQTC